jgi:hypothetical protein
MILFCNQMFSIENIVMPQPDNKLTVGSDLQFCGGSTEPLNTKVYDTKIKNFILMYYASKLIITGQLKSVQHNRCGQSHIQCTSFI